MDGDKQMNRLNTAQIDGPRIYYDSFTFCWRNDGAPYPAQIAFAKRKMGQLSPKLESQWDTLYGPKCKFAIEVYDQSYNPQYLYTVDNLHFGTLNDLMSYLDASMPHYTHTDSNEYFSNHFVIRCYDEEDENIPHIHTVYGMNRAFSMLKGSKLYKSSVSTAEACAHPLIDDLIVDAANQFGGFPDISGIHGDPLIRRLIWIGQSSRTTYGMPIAGDAVMRNFGDSTLRRMYHRQTGTIVEIPEKNSNHLIGSTEGTGGSVRPEDPKACILSPDGTSWDWINPNHSTALGSRVATPHDYSAVMFFPIHYSMGGDNFFAFYVKPIGIDIVRLNWYDLGKYDLEVVNKKRDVQPTEFNTISPQALPSVSGTPASSGRFETDHVVIPKSQWLDTNYPLSYKPGSYLPGRYYFRLRDKMSGKIGKESYASVYLQERRRHIPEMWMVKRRSI